MKKVQLPAIVDKISTMADGSVKISFVSQELNETQATGLFGLRNLQGWLLFAETELKEKDIPEITPEFPGSDKTPSQRLRNTIWIHWRDNTSRTEEFDTYYKRNIKKIIDRIKENLS